MARYLDVLRWNSGGDIGMRYGTDYAGVAETLQVHVDDLKAADHHVHYTLIPELAERVRNLLAAQPEIDPDYYHPVQATAFCGTYTLHLKLRLQGCRQDLPDLQKRARDAITALVAKLPEEVGGLKATDARYECTRLGTEGSLDVAFLWRRGEGIRDMTPSAGTYGKTKPEHAPHWHQREWNQQRPMRLPPPPSVP